VGSYIYKKNGVVILDNMNMFNGNIEPDDMPILVFRQSILFVYDYGIITRDKPKFVRGWMGLLAVELGEAAKLTWKLEEEEGDIPDVIADVPQGFTIPDDVILTKVQ